VPAATILVNLSIPLLGYSHPGVPMLRYNNDEPARPKIGVRANNRDFGIPPPRATPEKGKGIRPRLRIERGEWVVVVGWLDGQDERVLRKVSLAFSAILFLFTLVIAVWTRRINQRSSLHAVELINRLNRQGIMQNLYQSSLKLSTFLLVELRQDRSQHATTHDTHDINDTT